MKEDLHDIRYQIQNDIMVNHTDILKEILLHDNYQTKDNFVFQIYPSTQKMIEKFSQKPQSNIFFLNCRITNRVFLERRKKRK